MWVVWDCFHIEAGTYKVFGGHVVGGSGDVSKYNATVLRTRVAGKRQCLDLVCCESIDFLVTANGGVPPIAL